MMRWAFRSGLAANGLPALPAPVAGSRRRIVPSRPVGSACDPPDPRPAALWFATCVALSAAPYTATSSRLPGHAVVVAPSSAPEPILKGTALASPAYGDVPAPRTAPSNQRLRLPVASTVPTTWCQFRSPPLVQS